MPPGRPIIMETMTPGSGTPLVRSTYIYKRPSGRFFLVNTTRQDGGPGRGTPFLFCQNGHPAESDPPGQIQVGMGVPWAIPRAPTGTERFSAYRRGCGAVEPRALTLPLTAKWINLIGLENYRQESARLKTSPHPLFSRLCAPPRTRSECV